MKIRLRLILSFLIIICVLSSVIAGFMLLHFYTINEYRKLTENLILENRFTESVPDFIETYYKAVLAPTSKERRDAYMVQRDELLLTISRLDEAIVYDESKVSYRGLKNVISVIIENSDKGIRYIEKGNLTAASAYYNDALNKKFFVIESTANLMIKELKYAELLQEEIDRTYNLIILMVSLLTLIVIIACVVFALLFSHRLTVPIIRLSRLANEVAKGKMKSSVDKSLLKRGDEIGSLSKSIDIMIGNLRTKIEELEEANEASKKAEEEAEKSKIDIEKVNTELERFNKLAVGRELKMVELKKKIRELESKKVK